MVLNQDMVRIFIKENKRVIVIERKKYTEKCLDHDSTKTIARKIHRSICKIRNNLTKEEFGRFYPQSHYLEIFTAQPNNTN